MKKSKTRLFINKTLSSNLMIYIKDKQHHFLKSVLRVKINDKINLFDGISGEWESFVLSINRDNTVLRISKNIKKITTSNDIWLIFAPIKQHRMSLAIQKATELGVSKIIPCTTEYTNIKKVNLKSLYDNAVEASEQSLRLDIPKIEKTISLESLFLKWPTDRKIIYCSEKISNSNIIDSLTNLKKNDYKWATLIGPEGGFSDSEHKFLINNQNILPVSLGDKLLRSDTAITVSLFCIHQLLVK